MITKYMLFKVFDSRSRLKSKNGASFVQFFFSKRNFLTSLRSWKWNPKKVIIYSNLMSEKSIYQNIFPEVLGTARCFLLPEVRCLYMDQTQNHKTIVWFWLWDMCPENYRMSNSPVPRENNCTKVLQLLNKATKHTECKLHTKVLQLLNKATKHT